MPLTSVTPNPGYTELAQGNRGDPVLWMQEHLAAAIPTQATSGIFDATTAANLKAIPGRARDRAERQDRSRHLAGAAGPAPRRGQLDGERAKQRLAQRAQTRWIRVPVPRPPPQHMVTKPISLSERSSSCSSVVISRAPVEPSG